MYIEASEMFQGMIIFKTTYDTQPNVTNITLIVCIDTLFPRVRVI